MTSLATHPPDAGVGHPARSLEWLPVLFVTAIALALFAIRLITPSDLMDNDQQRPASYAMDALVNGNWVVQRDQTGEMMSKPPLTTWLTAIPAIPFGRLNLFLLYLPCLMATLGIAWLILGVGMSQFGRWAGLLGAVAYLLSGVAQKQIALARTDTVFALTVFAGALIAWRAWRSGGSWTWFWLLAAAATLTKGPVGVVLALGGLLAVFFERPCAWRPRWRAHLPGVALFLTLTLGWFALASLVEGRDVWDKMIGRELVGHVVKETEAGEIWGPHLIKPTLYFLSRFMPWGVFAALGLWRVWRRPATDAGERRFELYIACYFLLGLVLFSIPTHQRADHLWPLIPAGALLAGRELARLAPRWVARRRWLVLTGAAGAFLTVVFVNGQFVRPRDSELIRNAQMEAAAAEIVERFGRDLPLEVVDTPYTLQFHLGTMRRLLDYDTAAERLAGGERVYMAIQRIEEIDKRLPTGVMLHELARWPIHRQEDLRIISNQP